MTARNVSRRAFFRPTRATAEMVMEQNFGPHIEQKFSRGRVRAVARSSARLSWPLQAHNDRYELDLLTASATSDY
jgi:hypothetical protein